MSIDKQIIDELLKQGFNYAAIARQFKVSRQRVHQIAKNYKNYGRSNREDKYRNMGICEECNIKNAILLHHKDFNNTNDNIENLLRLCQPCHIAIHIKRKNKIVHPYILNILNISDVARELKVHRLTVRKWIKKGLLKAAKINNRGDYQITREDLYRYLESVK